MPKRLSLSKTKFMHGLSCPMWLWTEINQPETLPKPDEIIEARFEQGHQVGDCAQKLHPNGIKIGQQGALEKTKELLPMQRPLFEATFATPKTYCRVDILVPRGAHGWDLIEVKQNVSVKSDHIIEVAFQQWTAENAGIPINKTFLCHVNREYVLDGEIDVNKLFITEDITEEVKRILPTIEPEVDRLIKMAGGPKPQVRYGIDCATPKDCPCCSQAVENVEIATMTRGGKQMWEAVNHGITQWKQLPESFELTEKQAIQKKSALTGKPHIDSKMIKAFLSKLHYPIHFLDFETINLAIPHFQGTRPHQHVPFQFSLRAVESDDAKPVHVEFLADGKCDPRSALVEALKPIVDAKTIVAYNARVERDQIAQLAKWFPDEADWLNAAANKFVDLWEPFNSFAYYHPDQKGSASMKDVLPALTGKSYAGLAISEGNAAQLAWLGMLHGKITGKELEKTRKALLDYCGLDTQGMIEVVRELRKLVD